MSLLPETRKSSPFPMVVSVTMLLCACAAMVLSIRYAAAIMRRTN